MASAEEAAVFEEMGLAPGERKCYLALLETGLTSAGPLIKRTGMQKSAVYFCLERLLDKGLASFVMRNNIKYFEAARPERLLEYVDEREKELEEHRKRVQALLPGLERIVPRKEVRMARVYEGWEGMKSAFKDIVDTLREGDDYLVFSVSPEGRQERFRRFISKFHAARCRKKIRLKIIVNETLRETVGRDREAEPYTRVKYTSSAELTPAAINVYGNKVLIALWTDTPTGFTIESKEVADSFRIYFNNLWSDYTRTYRGLEGIKELIEDTLNYKQVLNIGGGGSIGLYLTVFYHSRLEPECIRRGIKWRIIGREEMREGLIANARFVEMKYFSKSTLSPASPNVIWIYGDKVVNVLWGKDPVAFSVQNAKINKNYRDYFRHLWNSSSE